MDESLLPNDNDSNNSNRGSSSDILSASQASLQRSASLLERIRAQREREAMGENLSSSALPTHTTDSNTMESIGIPNYAPIANDALGGETNYTTAAQPPSARSVMGASSLNFSGLIRGFGRNHHHASTTASESTRGLLDSSFENNSNGYSMSAYFRMFVMDVYTYFRSLPIPVQAGLIVFSLWIIYRLI